MFFDFNDYREILNYELTERIKKNKRYSLRAFARDIGLSPSRLSQVLAKKQGLSLEAAQKIAEKLGYQKSKKNYFCDLVESIHARSKTKKEIANKRLDKYKKPKTNKISIDSFKLISDWYHYAIIELISLTNFDVSIKNIADKLSISEEKVVEAIERLKRLHLITEKNGKLIETSDSFTTGDVPSDAIKNFHTQILEKASKSIYEQPPDERDISSIIISLNKSDIKKIKEIIKSSRRKIAEEISDSEHKDGVYCLAIQFFNILKE